MGSESIGNEAAVTNLVQWLLSNGEQGECPEWYHKLKDDQAVADVLRCSVSDVARISSETYTRALIAFRAEEAVRKQKDRETGRFKNQPKWQS